MEQPTEREAQLAREYNDLLQRRLVKKRTASILFCAVCLAVALALVWLELPMLAYCAGLVAVICLLQCLDAHGQLQEVRRRSRKTLVPRLSLLARQDHTETQSQGQTFAPGS